MNKLVWLLLPLFFFLANNTAKANVIEWQQRSQELTQERLDLKEQLIEIEGLPSKENEEARERNISIVMKDNKLAAEQKAYDQAIQWQQQGQIFSFSPATLQPGEKAPSEYIPIYKAAEQKYGVDWYILASIHNTETSFSTHSTMVSSVGAIGHMQFMPSTFKAYGVDGDGDGHINAWDLEDAIFSAANYLQAVGYQKDIRKAIWHYNHSQAYVNKIIQDAWGIKGI